VAIHFSVTDSDVVMYIGDDEGEILTVGGSHTSELAGDVGVGVGVVGVVEGCVRGGFVGDRGGSVGVGAVGVGFSCVKSGTVGS
jgi:hypothetical protein